jgi:hypothetical protein
MFSNTHTQTLRHTRQDGKTMVAFDRCADCIEVAKSWYGRPFESVISRAAQKEAFAKDFEAARAAKESVDAGEDLGFPWPMSMMASKSVGFRTEVVFWFLSLIDFHQMFKLEPKQIGLVLSPWFDEVGHDVKGVFCKPDASQPPDSIRRVVMFYESKWVKQEDRITPDGRLRLTEVDEAFAHVQLDESKKRPKDSSHVLFG